ncbi:MAG: exosortase system-associated protein, TIGR04073 family [Myxococcota bacterium]
MRPRSLLVCAIALVWLLPAAAGAVEALEKPGIARKAARGFGNLATCYLEWPGTIYEMSKERGPVWGASLGFVEGLGKTIPRAFVGLYEFLSSPVEYPAKWRPILEPEFTWQYFEDVYEPWFATTEGTEPQPIARTTTHARS